MWLTVQDPDRAPQHELLRIDLETNEIVASIPIGDAANDVAVGAGSVWVISYVEDTGYVLLRIDPGTHDIVATIPLNCLNNCVASSVTVEDGIWVTIESPRRSGGVGQIIRIDPQTLEVQARIPVEGWPRDVVAGEGAIWVLALTHFGNDTVEGASIYRVDPATNQVVATLLRDEIPPIAGATLPQALAVGEGALWTVVPGDTERPTGDLAHIDPTTNEVIARIAIEGYPIPFAVGEGGVWLLAGISDDPRKNHEGRVARLNPETRMIDASVTGPEIGGIDATYDPGTGTIWLAQYQDSLVRIDLR